MSRCFVLRILIYHPFNCNPCNKGPALLLILTSTQHVQVGTMNKMGFSISNWWEKQLGQLRQQESHFWGDRKLFVFLQHGETRKIKGLYQSPFPKRVLVSQSAFSWRNKCIKKDSKPRCYLDFMKSDDQW